MVGQFPKRFCVVVDRTTPDPSAAFAQQIGSCSCLTVGARLTAPTVRQEQDPICCAKPSFAEEGNLLPIFGVCSQNARTV